MQKILDKERIVPNISSVAVLPFKDFSPKKDQEHLCDGLAEELINRLTYVENLKVPARTSSFSFNGDVLDIQEIGEKLNVRNVIEGSIQKDGKKLRITIQLINTSDGYHIWSEKFEGDIRDFFALQDKIALAVVQRLRLDLTTHEMENPQKS